MIKEIVRAVVILGIVFILGGCHTIEGIGEDIQDGARSGRVWLRDYAQE